MACSKYKSTKETTNAVRLSRLLLDPCTDLLRDLLRTFITEIQFPHFLRNFVATLIPNINKDQRNLLYPRSGQYLGTYKEFDLSLLYILLRNISGIPPHKNGWGKHPDPSDRSLSANIDRIREIRNTYCGHATRVALADTEFHQIWKDMTVIICELQSCSPTVCMNYTTAAKLIKMDTMDPEQEKEFLDIIDKQRQFWEDFKAKTEKFPCERSNMLDNAAVILQRHKSQNVYTRTSVLNEIIEKLIENKILILTGKAGSGKTTTAYQVMSELSDECLRPPYKPAILNSPDEWNKVINPNEPYIVFLDDFIGSTNLDKGAIDKWKTKLDAISACTSKGQVLTLIGLRGNILVEAQKYDMQVFFSRKTDN